MNSQAHKALHFSEKTAEKDKRDQWQTSHPVDQ